MKIKLFGKNPVSLVVTPLSGGYDTDTARVTFAVKADEETAGVLLLDPAEARRMADIINMSAPSVTKVDTKVENGQ